MPWQIFLQNAFSVTSDQYYPMMLNCTAINTHRIYHACDDAIQLISCARYLFAREGEWLFLFVDIVRVRGKGI